MADVREKFAAHVDPKVLAEVRTLAQTEGHQLQALVEEALADLFEKREQTRPHAGVLPSAADTLAAR